MNHGEINRREFLKRTGVCAAALTLSGCSLLNSQQLEKTCPHGLINDPWPGECRDYIDRNGNGICDYSETGASSQSAAASNATETSTEENKATETPAEENSATETPTEENNTPTSSSTANSTSTPSANSQSSAQTFACNRGCSYPGKCGRYTDSNNNSICDWSETIVSSGQNSSQSNGGGYSSGHGNHGPRR